MRSILCFAAAVTALGLHAQSASPAATVAAQVREALVRDDRFYFEEQVIDQATRGRDTDDLREIIDQYDCLTLNRFDWEVIAESPDSIALRLDLDASGVTKALSRPSLQFPRWWRVEAKRAGSAWKLTASMSEERWVALQMLAAPSTAEADRIYGASRHLDLQRIIFEYADEIETPERKALLDYALGLARENRDTAAEVFVLRGYGLIGIHNFSFDYAPYVQEALAVALERGTPDDRADAYFTLGVLHGALGFNAEARSYLASSAALAETSFNPILPLKSKMMQSYFERGAGGLLESLRSIDELMAESRKYGWTEGEEQAMFGRAEIHALLGNQEVALEHYRDIVRMGLRGGNLRFVGHALLGAASHEAALGRPENAIRDLERAIEIWPRLDIQPAIYTTLAGIYIERGQYPEAEAALRKGEEAERAAATKHITVPPSHPRLRSELHLRNGRIDEAIEQAKTALAAIASRTDIVGRNEEALAQLALGRAYRAAGRTDEAILHLRESVNATESRRESVMAGEAARIAYFSDRLNAYVELVELLVERGKHEEAFRVAEQMKGRALRDVIAGGRINLSAAMTAAERAREEELEKRVLDLNLELQKTPAPALRTALADARRQLDAYEAEIRLAYPGLVARRVGAGDEIELPDAARSLAVVAYVVANRQTIAFCLTRNAAGGTVLHAEPLPVGREELERAAARFARMVGSRSLTYRDEARLLYKQLLQPLENHFAGAAALAIIPDGTLWNVPFQALIAPDGTHLVERKAVFYAHSLALLRHATKRPASPRPHLLAFGNPTVSSSARATVRSAYRNVILGTLPEAEDEVRSLRAMYSPERSRAYWRDAARELVFKQEAEDFDIIHVAAHAVVDDRAPMYSAIVLAASRSGESEDGLLEAREVVDLPLKADLAVLSACDTARGQLGAGEGVVGIAWAFFAAGCPTTVVSQWKAESRATSKLMIEFHRRLLAGATVAEALRGAQLTIRKDPKYAHPFYWAPFVAVGGAARDVAGPEGRPR